MTKVQSILLSFCLMFLPVAAEAQSGWKPSDVEERVRIHDNAAGKEVPFSSLVRAVSGKDVVFVGETHLDESTHMFEAAILDALAESRDNRVILSLEMFERDEQEALDDFIAGRIDEATFLERADPWDNHWTGYRPLLDVARRRGLRVIAANAPRRLLFKLAMGKEKALDALSEKDRRWVSEVFFPGRAEYWEKVDRAVRGHGMGRGPRTPEQRLYDGQNIWDNTMAESITLALKANPGFSVVHVVGGFHVAYGLGTADQVMRRKPDADVAVIEVEPAFDLLGSLREPDPERADFEVRALVVARGRSSGTDAVFVPRELKFRLVVPQSATKGTPLPLLVWLPRAGSRGRDAEEYWKTALGDEAIVACVEGPLGREDADLAWGGFWTSPGRFREDMGELTYGLDRLVAFLRRHYPVDASRICVAGEAEGGAAAIMAARAPRRFEASYLAFTPRPLGQVLQQALGEKAPQTRSVTLRIRGEAESAERIAADFAQLGVTQTQILPVDEDDVFFMESGVRDALGLEGLGGWEPDRPLEVFVLDSKSPRAMAWARLQARRFAKEKRRVTVLDRREAEAAAGRKWALAVHPSDLMDGKALPVAPADFGGVTVLVVPEGSGEAEAWKTLETQQVIRKKSPFARLRVAFEKGTPSLAEVIGDLRSKSTKAVVVVPAVFCADASAMWAMRMSLPADLAPLELTWMPGLGSGLDYSKKDAADTNAVK